MSTAERRSVQIEKTRALVYERDAGICQNCGSSVMWPGQLAHILSQSEMNIARYGAQVIHHSENMALVCCLECNDAMLIDGDKIASRAQARHILDEIAREGQ